METKIYISKKGLHDKEEKVFEILNGKLIRGKTYAFNCFQYKSIWDGEKEDGLELVFFEELKNKELDIILSKLQLEIKIDCFYIKNRKFEGCIKEYLYGKGKGCKTGKWLN